MNKRTRIVFIINPKSGTRNKEGLPEQIDAALDHERIDHEVVFTQYRGHAAELTRQYAEEHTDVVVAVGGDGTVNEVARSLVHTETALGILPSGSGNGLARHLCIPINMKGALDIINHGKTDFFDYGAINDQPFFCTCGMGFDAFVSLKFAEAGKRGLVTYVENVLKEGLKYEPDTYTIEDETGKNQYKAFLVTCANAAQYGNNAYIAPGASMQDGLMDVIIMEPFNVIEAPTIVTDLFAKTLSNNSHIKTFQARSIRIRREHPGAVHFDGDPIKMGTDIHVSIKPLGLKAVINPDTTEDPARPHPMVNAITSIVDKILT